MKQPPDHVHNPTYPCSCSIAIYGNKSSIVYCPTHAVAHEMAVLLRRLDTWMIAPDMSLSVREEWRDGIRALFARITP